MVNLAVRQRFLDCLYAGIDDLSITKIHSLEINQSAQVLQASISDSSISKVK